MAVVWYLHVTVQVVQTLSHGDTDEGTDVVHDDTHLLVTSLQVPDEFNIATHR